MKNFKDFELNEDQKNNSLGQGRPDWAGKPDKDAYGSYDADGEWVAPWEGTEGGRRAWNEDQQTDPA